MTHEATYEIYADLAKPAGGKLYIIGAQKDQIHEYRLPVPFDISAVGAVSVSTGLTGAAETDPSDLFFRPNGRAVYVAGNSGNNVYQFSLSRPWDLSSMGSVIATRSIASDETDIRALSFSNNGSKLYIAGNASDSVFQYSLSTPWDLATSGAFEASLDVSSEDTVPRGLFFKPDGTKLYVAGGLNDTIYQYPLETPWDIGSAGSVEASKSITTEDITPTGIFIRPDGLRLFLSGAESDAIFQYPLSAAWDISTAGAPSVSFSVSDEDLEIRGLFLAESPIVRNQDVLSLNITRTAGTIFDELRSGECELILDNEQGDYSPANVTGPFSLSPGGQLRIEATTDTGSFFGLFNGFVQGFELDSQLGRRQTLVRALDVAQFFPRKINTGLLAGTNTGALLSAVMSDAAIPSSMFSVDNKLVDVHPFAFLDDISAGEAVDRIVQAGAHFSSVDGDGVFRVNNRNFDLDSTPQASYENNAFSTRFSLNADSIMNDIRLQGTTREETSVTSVAGLLGQEPVIAASASSAFFLQYQDPDTFETPLPVNSLATPVALVDWNAVDPSSVDITNSVSLTVTAFAQTAKVDIFNGTGDDAFLVKLILNGIPLTRRSPFISQKKDLVSQANFEKRSFSITSNLFESVNFADDYSAFLDSRFSEPLADVAIAQRNTFPDVLQIDLLDSLNIVDSLTGVGSEFIVIGLEHAVSFEEVGTVHTATYQCRLRFGKEFLILDKDPEGKLDIRTLGF